jgi:hypothetical protein
MKKQKGKPASLPKSLKTNGGVEEGRIPDLCIANAKLRFSESPYFAVKSY